MWPYDDLNQRMEVRAAANQDPNWPPKAAGLYVSQETEVFNPAPFMGPLPSGQFGNIYEMRIYTYEVGSMPEVLKRWEKSVPDRVKRSPLIACWYSELGALNKFIHIWPYSDFQERERIRGEAMADPNWPPNSREFLVRQENKLLIPASFSPLH